MVKISQRKQIRKTVMKIYQSQNSIKGNINISEKIADIILGVAWHIFPIIPISALTSDYEEG